MSEMTREERGLLLYLETRSVDYCGRVDQRRMNQADFEIVERWNKEGFISFGRIVHADAKESGAYWCRLHDEAISKAAELRRELAEKGWQGKMYETTAEKRTKDKFPGLESAP